VIPRRVVLFDLDDTLYDRRQFLSGAFADVAADVARETGRDVGPLMDSLRVSWEERGSDAPDLFDGWLRRNGSFARDRVLRSVRTYHAYRPARLDPYDGADAMLRDLQSDHLLGLVSDGNVATQRAKLEALGLAHRFQAVVFSAELQRSKPDPEVFRVALERLGASPDEAVHVGDHPLRDVAGARRAGLLAVRVMTGEFRDRADLEGEPAHQRIDRLADLVPLLRRGSV